MDPLSIATGITCLLTLAFKTITALDDYKTSVTDAPAEIQSLVEELRLLASILSGIEKSIPRRATKGGEKGKDGEVLAGDVNTLVAVVDGCQGHLSKVLERLQGYEMRDDSATGKIGDKYRALFKRLRYPLNKEYVQGLLTVVRDHKATLTLALSLDEKQSMDAVRSTLSRLETASIESRDNIAGLREQNTQLLTVLINATDNIKPPRSYSDTTGASAETFFDVPQNPTATFVGRADVLADIEGHFRREKDSEPRQRRCAIYGLGGSGKTQVALKYAFTHRSSYQHVFFLNASSDESATAGFARIHGLLRLPSPAGDRDAAKGKVEAVKAWLSKEGNANWLLILDNADDLDELDLWDYIPVAEGGDVLITTRDAGISDPEVSSLAISLEVLPLDDAVTLLLKRAGFQGSLSDEHRESATEITRALGCLPLALDQAGAYIHARKKSCAEYLTLYQAKQESLLGYKSKLSRHQKTVLVTWELSFERIETRSPDVATLLLLLCQYDGSYISDAMLRRGTIAQISYSTAGEEIRVPAEASGIPTGLCELLSDEEMFDEAVETLGSYSLVGRVAGGGFVLHSLVAFCGRRRAGEEKRRDAEETAVRLLSHAFPRGSLDDWNTAFSIEFLPQVQHFCQCLEQVVANGNESPRIGASAASMFLSAYHFANTHWKTRFVELCGKLLAAEQSPGDNGLMTDPEFLRAFLAERRGKICGELGEPEKGVEILRAFVQTRSDISGGSSAAGSEPNHLANSMQGCVFVLLAHQLIGTGKPEQALKYLEEWRPLGASSYSERSVERYRDRTLADFFVSKNRWGEAEDVLRRLLSAEARDAETYAGTLGEGWTIQQLAEILMENSRYEEARGVLSPAIETREGAGNYGREDTVLLMLDLVRCLLGQGDYGSAMTQLFKLRKVLAQQGSTGDTERGNGSETSPEAVLGNLTHMWCLIARLSCHLGDFADAKACFDRALGTAGRVHWPNGFMVAAIKKSLGYTKWKLGEVGYREHAAADVGDGDLENGRMLTDAGIDREWMAVLMEGNGVVCA